jgi:hypothetical protein
VRNIFTLDSKGSEWMILYINKNGVKYSTTDLNLFETPIGNNINHQKKIENIEAQFELAFKTIGERS